METFVQKIEILLLIAAIVAMAAKKFHIPYVVGLVLAGIVLAVLHLPIDLPLTKELVYYILLPPLIFEAAFFIPWPELKKDLPVIGVFATLGVALSALVTAFGMHHFAGWEWQASMIFGTLIAATDPVSVIATFKEAGAHGRLRLLVEAESLLNDGTAAVAFTLALAFAAGENIGMFQATNMLVMSVCGGLTCGAVVAWSVLTMAGRTDDHLVEITFTTVAAWGSFLLAEHFHLSGIIATMTAGLILGNRGSLGAISDKGRGAVLAFWDYAAFVSNSIIFLLMGIHLAKQNVAAAALPALVAIAFVLLGRAVAIYPVALIFKPTRLRVKMKHQHVMFWGGLRGALALALALGLPETMPQRDSIITAAFTVAAFSILVQGMTMGALLRHFKEIPAHFKKATKS